LRRIVRIEEQQDRREDEATACTDQCAKGADGEPDRDEKEGGFC
jgi:hypothetical protein